MDFKILLRSIGSQLNRKALESEDLFIPLGAIGFIGFGFYYLVWQNITPTSYENMYLRLIAMLLCLGLIIKNYWPMKLRFYLPFYWHFTIFYIMPFFFTFMLFKNNFSGIWVQNSMTALFFLILLTDWLELTILLFLGILSGFLLYALTTHPINIPGNLFSIIFAYLAVIGVGSLFVYIKLQKQKEKLQTMQAIGETVAHELRTPLRTISSSAIGLKEYFPQLIEAYKRAKEHNIDVPKIPKMHYEALDEALKSIDSEVNAAFNFINIFLINASQSKLSYTENTCSIVDCVNKALERYHFDPQDRALIKWNPSNDFLFKGDELLIIHVLFNLLKNAIYYVRAARKGDISISLDSDPGFNVLYFKDTGTGISAKVMPHIFKRFFSNTYHGTGIGLAYCKSVMQGLGGDITCRSKEGEFTEFKLIFPKIKN